MEPGGASPGFSTPVGVGWMINKIGPGAADLQGRAAIFRDMQQASLPVNSRVTRAAFLFDLAAFQT